MNATHTTPALSAGWQVTVETEAFEAGRWFEPYVTDRATVVEAVAELVGRPVAEVEPLVEEVDEGAPYGVWMVPLLPQHVEELAALGSAELLATLAGRSIWFRVEEA